jgi:serine/threonine protein kinase
MGEQANQAQAIFLEAIEKHPPDEWPVFVAQACAGDDELRRQVEQLLHAQVELGTFHEPTPPGELTTLDEPIREGPGTVVGPYKPLEAIGEATVSRGQAAKLAALDAAFMDYGAQAPAGGDQCQWLAGEPPIAPNKPLLLNEFEVEQLLGEGGMGKVYLVRSRLTRERFAVKRTKLRTPEGRQHFLTELQTWLDLPAHPNLAACRFFRSVGDQVLIFAEYVAGDSLQACIRRGKLTTLEQILDIAIQFCWGLAAAHDCGLVHQDVKPSNVLITPDGRAKVTDFGLARGRAVEDATGPASNTILASWGGMTLAYCSPEQVEIAELRQAGTPADQCPKLTRRTDLWSWAISVLEAFVGKTPCPQGGQHAAEVFESFLLEANGKDQRPVMPGLLADLLRRCFHRDPAERWGSLTEVAQALQQLWQQTYGYDYWRPVPQVAARQVEPITAEPYSGGRVAWPDPRPFLAKAYQAAGRDPVDLDKILPPRTGSRKAQAIADMAAYEEAFRLVERAIKAGKPGLEQTLAILSVNNSRVHAHVGDLPAAIALSGRAISLLEPLVTATSPSQLITTLAQSYLVQAGQFDLLDNLAGAIIGYDRAITLLEPLRQSEDVLKVVAGLAMTYANKGHAQLWGLQDARAARRCFDRAIALCEQLATPQLRSQIGPVLAYVCLKKADLLRFQGANREAVAMSGRAVALLERLVYEEGRSDLWPWLADAFRVNANCLVRSDAPAAIRLVERSISAYERLVFADGREELTAELAAGHASKGAIQTGRDPQAAKASYDRAIPIYERLVNRQGRRDLTPRLAEAYLGQAYALHRLRCNQDALRLSERAVLLYEVLVRPEDRKFMANLGWSKALRGWALLKLGNRHRAAADARAALQILKREAASTGSVVVQSRLKIATQVFRRLLGNR